MSMSEKSKTKVWGTLTRDLLRVFQEFADEDDHLHFTKLREACNALDLYPSTSQVHEMLMCAIEYGSPCKADHITYGEFCVLVLELQSYYRINPVPPEPHSLIKVRPEFSSIRRKRRESLAHFQVFLGGSCNPTRWRADIAIPYFKEHGITFYNPQVQHWKPELMELEEQAKQTADILFFVIDSRTRAVSSMIEVAYLVACQRQVVVTMCLFNEPNITVDGELLTEFEMLNLVKGRLILTDLIERNSVPTFNDIQHSLNCTRLMIKENVPLKDLTVKDGAHPVKYGHLKLGQALLELREAFNSVDSGNAGYLTSSDVCLAYKCCTGDDLDEHWLKQRRKSQDQFVYEEFCTIVTEYKNQSRTPSLLKRFLTHILQPIKWLASKFSTPVEPSYPGEMEEIRDVYLGGSGSGDSHWRKELAEPLLRKYGLSYLDPDVIDWDQKLIPIHVSMREKCRLLLYVITGERRSLSSMCEAGYYAGKGCRMVLCVQKIPDNAVIAGEKLTPTAIRDYNRGRDYLSDLSNREGVPLFDDIMEALLCAVTMLTEQSSSGQWDGLKQSSPGHGSKHSLSSQSFSQLAHAHS